VVKVAALKPRAPFVENLYQATRSYVVSDVVFQDIAEASPGSDSGGGEVPVIADE
jgi:hypothetical protein